MTKADSKIHMRRILSLIITQICLLLSSPVWSQIPGFFIKNEERKTVVPFLNSNNLIIVPLSINGNPPINFLLDTGVRTNILFSKTLGDQLGLQYSRTLNLVGADGKTVLSASVTVNNHIDLGNVEGISQTLLVLDEDFFELESVIGIPVYGVIGYEFFKFNPMKINYDKGQITFYQPNKMRWRPLGYRKIAISIENSKPYVTAKVNQLSGPRLNTKLLIDTGANHGLLLNPETSDDIKLPPLTLASDLGRSLGGDLFGWIGRAKQLNLGGLKFYNVITSFPEENDYSYVIKETGRQGSLGSEVLSRMELILDYPRERMLFKKSSTFLNPFEYDMSGITPKLLPTEQRRVYIAGLKENSPAKQAGLEVLDEITKVNNIPIDFWEISDLIKIFRSEVGRKINLTILRANPENETNPIEMDFSFILRRQI
ncbi:aspartyl protease family protein [Belliella pelovolcani]|uniref:aspartyl protease family protein n=1 Tax=Belliella pelovolcani TaxID=529505 RepID=UPI00391DDAF8